MIQFRSLFFVPGNNSRFLEKAKNINTDILCFDLEDSVPDNEKPTARKMIKNVIKSYSFNSSVFIRTNSPASRKIPDDLKIIQKGVDGIVIPKVDNASELKKIINNMLIIEKKHKLKPLFIIPSIESAKGVVNAYQIASSSKRVIALVFGVFDLLNDMGIDYTNSVMGAKFSRAKIPLDAAAANIACIDAIWQDLKDQKGLIKDCKIGKELGYSGKSVIHPDQISVTHKIFHPTKLQIQWARKVYDTYVEATQAGRGATTINGKMIDEVHFKQAKTLLDITKSNNELS